VHTWPVAQVVPKVPQLTPSVCVFAQ
jgi:hypothetical protein